jgi:hypothetical protein
MKLAHAKSVQVAVADVVVTAETVAAEVEVVTKSGSIQ